MQLHVSQTDKHDSAKNIYKGNLEPKYKINLH